MVGVDLGRLYLEKVASEKNNGSGEHKLEI